MMVYRKEIDGLRALAVIPVILYHAGTTYFSGGFVGVDVFFVISGYLITSIIINEKLAGTFSLVNFYERRARRILPALFFVMSVCLPCAWLWLTPEDMKNFSQSLVAVSLFSSNVFFYLTTGYFLPAAELKPLLHTWSLAVEEQYYVIFPLLLTLIWKLGARWIVSIFTIISVLSLIAAQWYSVKNPSFNFFLLPTRAWEILIGANIAFILSQKSALTYIAKTQKTSQMLSILGLLFLLYSTTCYNQNIPFPSVYTLLPTLGAALIILFASEQTIVGKFLSIKLLSGIGLISYSAYLWHQPLFSFTKHICLEEPNQTLLLLLSFVSLILGYLSWRFIEKPFRNKLIFTQRKIFSLSVIGSSFFILIGLIGHLSNGFEYRLNENQKKIALYSKYSSTHQYHCFLEPEFNYKDFSKTCGETTNKANNFMIWGDSYAAALASGIRDLHKNVTQFTASSCPPILDISMSKQCAEMNQFVMQKIVELKPRKIFLHANWHTYDKRQALENTLKKIKLISPNSQVYIIGSVPQWRPTLPVYLNKTGVKLNAEARIKLSSHSYLTSVDNELIQISKTSHIQFISALNTLCVEDKCLATIKSNDGYTLSAWDNGHLTQEGALILAGKVLTQ